MALHGGQKKFDKNQDGKLSAGEWQSWYFATYGVDMEREEQRKKAQETALWNDRLGQMMDAARSSAESVVRAAQRLLPDRADAKELAWKAMLCQITAALKEGTEWKIAWRTHVGQMVSNSVVYPVQAVARDLMEVSGLFAPKEAGRMALPCRVLFQEVGELVQARPCGTFWREIILRLPPYDKEYPPEFEDGSLCLTLPWDEQGENDAAEDALTELLQEMIRLTVFFGDAESADHDLRGNRMLNCFCGHWQQIRGNYINFSDSSVKRMAEQNPALYDEFEAEELADMYSGEVLEQLYSRRPELVIAIWRSMAGTDEPIDDPEQARRFLDEMEWLWQSEYEYGDAERLRPLLDELGRDDGFARQICQSAYVSCDQQSLIMAAADCGKFALAEHLFSLLMKNPLPGDQWDLDVEELEELAEKLGLTAEEEPEGELPRDDTEYVYCKVHIPGACRDYAYLAGELPLSVGDWVKVPFGMENVVKRGKVTSVTRCTRRTAPWPPEETKTVLCMTEQPTEFEMQ